MSPANRWETVTGTEVHARGTLRVFTDLTAAGYGWRYDSATPVLFTPAVLVADRRVVRVYEPTPEQIVAAVMPPRTFLPGCPVLVFAERRRRPDRGWMVHDHAQGAALVSVSAPSRARARQLVHAAAERAAAGLSLTLEAGPS